MENVDYAIFDVTGKRMMKGKSSSQSFFLNMEDVPNGLYLLKLEWEGGTKTIRLQVL
jgi:hypothetical protein